MNQRSNQDLNQRSNQDLTDLREMLRPIWSRRYLILIAAVLAAAASYVYFDRQPRTYTSSTRLFLRQSDVDRALFGTSGASDTGGDDRTVQNQALLLKSRATAAEAARILNYRGDPEQLLGLVSATAERGSDFLTITASAADPQQAADVANAFASGFSRARRRELVTKASDARKAAEGERDRILGTTQRARRARDELTARISRLRTLETLPTGVGVQQIDRALPFAVPTGGGPQRKAAFAGVFALFLACCAAFGLDLLDRRIRRLQDVMEAYDVELLGVVPRTKQPAPIRDGRPTLPRDLRESFRTLRVNLEVAGVHVPLQVMLVTSALPKEGKSTVVRNLALANFEAGKRVVVVDADFRHPALAGLLGAHETAGLSDVLTGTASLSDVIQPIHPGGPGEDPADSGDAAYRRLDLLASGPIPRDPAAALASDRFVATLEVLRREYDAVLIDSAPLLVVSDAVLLLGSTDCTLLVTRPGRTVREAAQDLQQLTGRVEGLRLVGVVANQITDDTLWASYEKGYGRRYAQVGGSTASQS